MGEGKEVKTEKAPGTMSLSGLLNAPETLVSITNQTKVA